MDEAVAGLVHFITNNIRLLLLDECVHGMRIQCDIQIFLVEFHAYTAGLVAEVSGHYDIFVVGSQGYEYRRFLIPRCFGCEYLGSIAYETAVMAVRVVLGCIFKCAVGRVYPNQCILTPSPCAFSLVA